MKKRKDYNTNDFNWDNYVNDNFDYNTTFNNTYIPEDKSKKKLKKILTNKDNSIFLKYKTLPNYLKISIIMIICALLISSISIISTISIFKDRISDRNLNNSLNSFYIGEDIN